MLSTDINLAPGRCVCCWRNGGRGSASRVSVIYNPVSDEFAIDCRARTSTVGPLLLFVVVDMAIEQGAGRSCYRC